MQPAPLPVAELASLGEKLQQAIVLTRMRLANSINGRLKARGARVVREADKLFTHLSQVVSTAQGLSGFLSKAMGLGIDDLFAYTGRPRAARGLAYAGVVAANEAVKNALNELAAVNAALDKEVKRDNKHA